MQAAALYSRSYFPLMLVKMETTMSAYIVEQFFTGTELTALVSALPADGSNPVGNQLRNITANYCKEKLPGKQGKKTAYQKIFFPKYTSITPQKEIPNLVSLSDHFWSDFSTALLCQRGVEYSKNIANMTKSDLVNQDVINSNNSLKLKCFRWYGVVAQSMTDDPIGKAMQAFNDSSKKRQALDHYREGLMSESWINIRNLQDAQGQWPDKVWELYHHFIKLNLLGASDEAIKETIETMIKRGLKIPDELKADKYQAWHQWYLPLNGDLYDDADGALGYKKSTFLPASGSLSSSANYYYTSFTGYKGPGKKYYKDPSRCCFAAGALVVMENGLLQTIETVKPGDLVQTPYGTRAVLLCATPKRNYRPLFRFVGSDFAFSGEHPFVMADTPNGPSFAAQNPETLSQAMPGARRMGISQLRQGIPLVGYDSRGSQVTVSPDLVSKTLDDEQDEVLFDLILELKGGDCSQFYVGDQQQQWLVSSELPPFLQTPLTTAVIVSLLQSSLPILETFLENYKKTDRNQVMLCSLQSFRDANLRSLLALAAQTENETMASVADLIPIDQLSSKVEDLLRQLPSAQSFLGQDYSTWVEFLVTEFSHILNGSINQGWRVMEPVSEESEQCLALSVHGLEVYQTHLDLAEHGFMTVQVTTEKTHAQYTVNLADTIAYGEHLFTMPNPLYFEQINPTNVAIIHISLNNTLGPVASRKMSIPLENFGHILSTNSIGLKDDNGCQLANIDFDLRCISTLQQQSEKMVQSQWSNQLELAFATKLNALLQQSLHAHLPALLQEYKTTIKE